MVAKAEASSNGEIASAPSPMAGTTSRCERIPSRRKPETGVRDARQIAQERQGGLGIRGKDQRVLERALGLTMLDAQERSREA